MSRVEIDQVTAVRRTFRQSALFSDFNTLQFASVMGMVLFVILLVFMTIPVDQRGVSADIPRVFHAVAMPGAAREDAMLVTVLRDGKIYFGDDQVSSGDLTGKIQQRLKNNGVERKVFITADIRARYAAVKAVLDAVRAAGISRVAFLVGQRRTAVPT